MIYQKLDEKDFELLKRAEKLTMTDYGNLGNFIPADSLMSVIEDLIANIDVLEEEIEDLKADMEQNYRPLSNRELYGDIEIL